MPEVGHAPIERSAIAGMIENGGRGRLVHVEDEAEGKTVEVWVE